MGERVRESILLKLLNLLLIILFPGSSPISFLFMKKIVLLSLLFTTCSFGLNAQVKDNAVEHMMTQRVLTCDDIYYNSVTLIPRLYAERKTDTLEAVLAYWKKNCGLYESAVCFTILYAIEHNNFREELTDTYKDSTKGNSLRDAAFYKQNIISYLFENRRFAKIDKVPSQYANYYYEAYVAYEKFIRSMAASLLNKPGLSHTERFLVEFYANPDTVQLSRLRDSLYMGSVLREAYVGIEQFGGVSYGLNAGMWHPTGNLSVLGNHPFLGAYIGGRSKGFSCDFTMNFAFQKTPNYYNVLKDDSLYHTNYFVGYYIGLDFGEALFRTRRCELALLEGIAYDGISTINNNNNNNNNNNDNNSSTGKTLNSLNLNAGLGWKFYLRHVKNENVIWHSFIGIQAKYNLVNYNNGGGTDLTGKSMNFCVTWGGYHKSIHHYYDKE